MRQTRTLYIDDLLSRHPIEVHGVMLDAHVSVVVRDVGDGPELDSLDIRDVYIRVDSYQDILQLDKRALETRHKALYELFENCLEVEALLQAKAAPDEAWSVEIDPDVPCGPYNRFRQGGGL